MTLPEKVDRLINAMLDGEATPGDVAELQSALANDEALAAQLADRIAEHRLLGLIHQPFDSQLCADAIMQAIESEERNAADEIMGSVISSDRMRSDSPPPPANAKYLTSLAIGVALSLLVVGTAWYFFRTPSPTESNPPAGQPIATLLLEENCRWHSGTNLAEGQRLAVQSLSLQSGVAVIRFDGGAELIMTGETSLALRSAGSAELQHGEVVIRAEEGAEGFKLGTPASPLTDLGTEFAVRVDRAGTTEVHVLDGEVEYLQGDSPEVIRAGKAIRFAGANKQIEDVQLNSPRFDEVVRRVNPRPQPQRMWVYEGFHYEPGNLPLDETTKGKGWAGPWRLRLPQERARPVEEVSPDHFEIVHGQLNVTWPVPGGRLGMLKLPGGGAFYVRPLAKSIDLDRDGVTFFSMMVRETERPTERRQPQELMRLTFRSSDDYFGESISFGHGPGYRPRVQCGKGITHTSPLVLPAEQTTLWIGKIVSRKTGEDEIYFRVYGENDVLNYAEPATWHVVTRGVELGAHLDRVLLSSSGTTARIVDELRIGPTWRSVAPMQER